MDINARYAAQLVKDVIDNLREHGLIVTISLESKSPLAMGNYLQIIDIRPTPQARKDADIYRASLTTMKDRK